MLNVVAINKYRLLNSHIMNVKKVKTGTLFTGLFVGLIFSLFIGIVGGSMGLGSRFPQLNVIATPFVCPGQQLSYTQDVSEIGTATYWTAAWFCVDEHAGSSAELDPKTVFLSAGSIYGLLLFVVLFGLTYLYWNSSIGPAKNDGLHLW
jgi:hypothetical protein